MRMFLHDLPGMLICSGVFYGLYAALLDRRVPFRWCRRYLLAAVAAATVIPLLRIPVWPGPTLTGIPGVTVGTLGTMDDLTLEVTAGEPGHAWWPLLAGCLYAAGVLAVALPAVRQWMQLRRLRRGAQIVRTEGYTLVRTQQPIAACSFFRQIFLPADTPETELPMILLHERSHVRHRHSAERLAMEAMKALLWWNPFVWLLAGRLAEVQEFEADSDVLGSGCDPQRYMQLMLKQLFGYYPEITNGLRNSLTKKRFKMMTTNSAQRYVLLRMAGVVPAVIGLLCAFSFTTRAANYAEPPAAEETAPKSAETPFLRAEVMPRFGEEGGDLLQFQYWVQRQVRYPQEAFGQGIAGRVIVSFVIETDGTLDEIEVLQSPSQLLSDEVIRVLKSSDKWTPGEQAGQPVRVKYTLPIHFSATPEEEQPAAARAEEVGAYLQAVQKPTYQGGGIDTFRAWVQMHIRFPQAAVEQELRGLVVASFVVEPDGSVGAVEVLKSPSELLSNELIRVLKLAERWEPGRNAAGEPVRVKFMLPIHFWSGAFEEVKRETDPLEEVRKEVEAIPGEEGAKIELTSVVSYR